MGNGCGVINNSRLSTVFRVIAGAAALITCILIAIHYRFYVVASGSMEPAVKVNHIAVVKILPPGRIQEGDIVAYRSKALGGAAVLHRVTGINENGFVTKGDNSLLPDGAAVTEENLIGKLTFTFSPVIIIAPTLVLFLAAGMCTLIRRCSVMKHP